MENKVLASLSYKERHICLKKSPLGVILLQFTACQSMVRKEQSANKIKSAVSFEALLWTSGWKQDGGLEEGFWFAVNIYIDHEKETNET